MKKLCPTCCGRGSIVDPKCYGMIIGYCGPNGETMPMIMCQTCGGSGWIYTAGDFKSNYVCAICKKTFNLDIDQSTTISNCG